MNIVESNIENFLAIGKADLVLNEKGLVLLQGENRDDTSQDSNGAGKSTIADALSWCLYSVTARGESGDDVINRSAGKNCRVSIKIEDSGETWVISRHRKHKTNKNRLIVEKLKDGKLVDATLGTDKLTQNLVNKIIGCSKEVFCSAIYAGQENLVDLPSMTDKPLKVIVEEAAGIDRLQRGYKIANERTNKAKREHNEANLELKNKESSIETTETNLEEAKILATEWEKEREKKMLSATEEREALVKELDATEEVDVSDELKTVELKLNKIASAIDAANTAKSNCAVLESKFSSALATVKREKSTYERLLEEVRKVEKELKMVVSSDNPVCGECGQEIADSEAKEAHVKAHEKRVSEKRKAAMEQETNIKEQGAAARELKSQLEEAKSKLTDTSKLKAAQEKLTELKTKLIAKASAITNLKTKIESKTTEFAKARDEKNPHEKMIKKLEGLMATLSSEKEAAQKVVDETEYRVLVAEGAAKVFGPSGVRAHLLDQVTPFLNDRTSHYLSILSDGNITATWTTLAPDSKGELKEKFSIAVESMTGGKSFKSLSGGEKRKVRLSTYLALQDLVSSRASKPINLLIADEIDQAVDKSGLERLMSILTEKAKERGTAIVISHTDLKSWISNSITVVKEDGVSRIEGFALS